MPIALINSKFTYIAPHVPQLKICLPNVTAQCHCKQYTAANTLYRDGFLVTAALVISNVIAYCPYSQCYSQTAV